MMAAKLGASIGGKLLANQMPMIQEKLMGNFALLNGDFTKANPKVLMAKAKSIIEFKDSIKDSPLAKSIASKLPPIPGAVGDLLDDASTIEEPASPYAAVYPFNHVRESESGHIEEWDDTPGAERLHRMHKSGTEEEIHPNGTKVTRVVKDNYEMLLGDDSVYVKGKVKVAIDESANMRINEKVDVQVTDGNVNITVLKGDMNLTCKDGNFKRIVEGNCDDIITGNYTLSAGAGAGIVSITPVGCVESYLSKTKTVAALDSSIAATHTTVGMAAVTATAPLITILAPAGTVRVGAS